MHSSVSVVLSVSVVVGHGQSKWVKVANWLEQLSHGSQLARESGLW